MKYFLHSNYTVDTLYCTCILCRVHVNLFHFVLNFKTLVLFFYLQKKHISILVLCILHSDGLNKEDSGGQQV